MSRTKFPAPPPARLCGAPAGRLAARRILLTAALALGAACGDDGGERNQSPPFTMLDSAVMAGDSSFIPPVIQPPPVGNQQEAGVFDAGTTPAAVDAGRMDAGPSVIMDSGALADANAPADSGSTNADAGTSGGDGGTGNPCGTGPEPLAANIRVHEISIYQTVKIPLYKSNAWVTTRNAAVVQGKKSLVRVFVTPQTGYQPHALRGVLTLDTDGSKTALISNRTISTTSTDAAADSTFDFVVDGALLKGSTQLSVSVLEPTCTPPAANSTGARLPATGGQALNADAINKLRVVIVPITLAGRTPDVSQAQLDKFKEGFLAFYPVSEVEVTAHAPVTSNLTPRADGGGWSDILNLVMQTRAKDAPAASVYYYGVMLPAASFTTYCRTGCVLGLAPLNRIVSRGNQIGLGVGFVDIETIKTAVHEIGHAHGLPHAPCAQGGSIQGADAAFPYAGAKIGVWGWDSRSAKLMSPTTYVDLMSYCSPEWISDYNYAKLATRSKSVNTAAYVLPGELTSQRWHGIVLRGDGSARWADVVQDQLPGEPQKARALDAHGSLIAEIEVAKVELSEGSDSFLYIPAPGPRWAKIDLGDRVLDLTSVLPAVQ